MDSMPNQRKRRGIGAWEKILAFGQNPKGFTAQTPAGTAKAGNCPGWNKDTNWEMPEVPAEGVWANANRSGE
jgi:hypothetical protein